MISRRHFLFSLPAAAFAAHATIGSAATRIQATRIFIGTGGRGPEHGIFTADWNATTGEIGAITLAAEVANPTFLAQHKRGRETIVYTVTEAGGSNAKIAIFDINRKTGLLAQVQVADGGGKNARHIALDPSQRWLVISHQDSNDLTVLERNQASGRLSAPIHSYPLNRPMCVVYV